jgi:hypothetical protein
VSRRGNGVPCISIMYAPGGDPDATAIMNAFIAKNNARTGGSFVMEPALTSTRILRQTHAPYTYSEREREREREGRMRALGTGGN